MTDHKVNQGTTTTETAQPVKWMSRRQLLATVGMAGATAALYGSTLGSAAGRSNSVLSEVFSSSLSSSGLNPCLATTISDLRNNEEPEADYMYFVTDPGQEGPFKYDAADLTSSDNTGLVLVSSSGARFKRVLQTEHLNVKWFGAKGNGVQDDSAAIKLAIETAVTLNSSTDVLGVNASILFPRGVYRITANNLFSNITYSGPIKRGVTFCGENMFSSILYLETSSTEKWFYNNGSGNHKLERSLFQDLGFTSDNDAYGNGFKIWSNGGEKQFKFFRCAFGRAVNSSTGESSQSAGGMNALFYFWGTGNADLMKFHSCVFNAKGTVFTLNNSQSVVIETVATDIITYKDIVLVEAGGGGCFNMIGGSCDLFMTTGDTARYIVNVVEGAVIGPGNDNFNFFGVRFEFQGANRAILNFPYNGGELNALFEGCNIGTAPDGGERDAVILGPAKSVTFRNCTLHEKYKYVLNGSYNSSSSAPSGGIILFDQCQTGLSTNLLYNRVQFTGNMGRVIARNCRTRGGVSYINKKVVDFDLNAQNAVAREPSAPLKVIHVKMDVTSFPFANGTNEYTVEFPQKTLIKSIYIKKPASGSSTQSYQLCIGTDDKSVIIGQSVSAQHKEEHLIDLRDLYLVTDATNSRLRFWASGAANVTQTGGVAVIEYY